MPQRPEAFFNDTARQTRLRRGYSIRGLATAASVSPNTVVRIEKGLPVRSSCLARIAQALHVTPARLEPGPLGRASAVHRHGDTNWSSIDDHRSPQAQSIAETPLSDTAERQRLGAVGLVEGFLGLFQCDIERGQLVPSVMELYGQTEELREHPGEEFVYCLEGRATISLPEGDLDLQQGDSAIFWSHQPHRYSAVDGPARLLVVCRETK